MIVFSGWLGVWRSLWTVWVEILVLFLLVLVLVCLLIVWVGVLMWILLIWNWRRVEVLVPNSMKVLFEGEFLRIWELPWASVPALEWAALWAEGPREVFVCFGSSSLVCSDSGPVFEVSGLVDLAAGSELYSLLPKKVSKLPILLILVQLLSASMACLACLASTALKVSNLSHRSLSATKTVTSHPVRLPSSVPALPV